MENSGQVASTGFVTNVAGGSEEDRLLNETENIGSVTADPFSATPSIDNNDPFDLAEDNVNYNSPSTDEVDTNFGEAIDSNVAKGDIRPSFGGNNAGGASASGSIKEEIVFPNEPDLTINVSDDEQEVLGDVIAYDRDEDIEEMIEIEYNHLSFHTKNGFRDIGQSWHGRLNNDRAIFCIFRLHSELLT